MRATPTSSANGSTAPPATERSALPVDRNGTHALSLDPPIGLLTWRCRWFGLADRCVGAGWVIVAASM